MHDSTSFKTCSKCRVAKPLDEFNKQSKSRDGHDYYCRECKRLTRPNYGPSKPRPRTERDAEANAKWRAENRERIRAYRVAYRIKNAEKVRAADAAYYAANAEKLRAEGAERAKNWRASSPQKAKVKDDRRRALKLEAFVENVDLTIVLERRGSTCVVCAEPIDLTLSHPHPMSVSLEHLIPLVRGGEHSYNNCAPSHLRCNLVKGIKTLGELAS